MTVVTGVSSLISSFVGSLLSAITSLLSCPRGDEMAHNRWCGTLVEFENAPLQILVGRGYAVVLPLMLEPRRDEKRLNHPACLCRIFVDVPVIGSIAQPL